MAFCISGCTKDVKNETVTITFAEKEVTGEFTGTLKDKLPDGEGEFKAEDGWSYTGNFEEGKVKGKGSLKEYPLTIEEDISGTYDGETMDGIAEGEGVFSLKNDDDVSYTYTGQWEDGLWNGEGELKFDSEEYCMRTGNFEKGEFKPTKLQWIKSYGTAKELAFSVNENSEKFISEHDGLFPTTKTSKAKKYCTSDVSYKKLIKTPDQYGDKLIKTTTHKVHQIQQDEVWGKTLTTLIIADEYGDDVYYVYYWGELKDIYAEDDVTCYGLPIDTSYYENVGGGTTNCVVVLGSYIEKN